MSDKLDYLMEKVCLDGVSIFILWLLHLKSETNRNFPHLYYF